MGIILSIRHKQTGGGYETGMLGLVTERPSYALWHRGGRNAEAACFSTFPRALKEFSTAEAASIRGQGLHSIASGARVRVVERERWTYHEGSGDFDSIDGENLLGTILCISCA